MSAVSRRSFLGALIAGGGALSLGLLPGCGGAPPNMVRRASEAGEFSPNMYITVLPTGRIALAINKAEIGQGVSTAYSALVAEELDTPLSAIEFYYADSFPEYRTSYMMHQTGGSTSVKEAYDPLRKAAATAREMLVTAAALEWNVPPAECSTENGQVRHVPSGKSKGYGELTKAAAACAVPENPKVKTKDQFKVIGKPMGRVDARSKVDGSGKFGMDVTVPNMVRALVIHPPIYGATPTKVKADAARKRPGIIAILQLPFGVAVVADKYWQALAASREVEVEWSQGQTEGLDSEKLRLATRDYKKSGGRSRNDGNVDDAISTSPIKVEAIYETPFLAHAPMEPQNCLVHVRENEVEVWAPCQSPTVIQEFVGAVLDMDREKVLVHTTLSGGGFGRRAIGDFAAQAALISKEVKRPVQMVWSRESDMKQGFYRPQTTVMMRGAVRDGKPSAFAAHVLGQALVLDGASLLRAILPAWMPRSLASVFANSAVAMFGTNTVTDMFATEGIQETGYEIPDVRVEFTPIATGIPACAWRSVGHSVNGFAAESFIDELAHAANQDPLEFRQRLLPAGGRPRRVLDAVAKLSGWGSPLPSGVGRGVARHTSFGSEVAEVAEVEIVEGRIKVRRVFCVVDCGIAVNPDGVRAQMEGAIIFGLSAALDQEITFVNGAVQQANFDTFPPLRMFESPAITVEVSDSQNAPSGAGEPGLPPIAPAVANAVFALTKKRLRRLPLQASWVREGKQ